MTNFFVQQPTFLYSGQLDCIAANFCQPFFEQMSAQMLQEHLDETHRHVETMLTEQREVERMHGHDLTAKMIDEVTRELRCKKRGIETYLVTFGYARKRRRLYHYWPTPSLFPDVDLDLVRNLDDLPRELVMHIYHGVYVRKQNMIQKIIATKSAQKRKREDTSETPVESLD